MTVSLMQERLPFVRFETRPIEDRDATIREGRYIAMDVDYAIIQPAGAKDTIEKRVDEWFATFMRPEKMQLGAQYRAMYDAWKQGKEIPLDGTSVRIWPVLSPAQVENLIACNLRTIEDVAAANEDAMRRMGMGGRALKQQAQAWLDSARDVGKVSEELNKLRVAVETLNARNNELETELSQLRKNKEKPRARKDEEE